MATATDTTIDSSKMTEAIGLVMQMKDVACIAKIIDIAKHRTNTLSDAWRVGDKVTMLDEFRGRKIFGQIGTIQKINNVKMVVKFEFMTYRIPKTMLRKVD
jgi:hypothetical protein